jgi:long-subunit fatty acid transport protein
MMAMTVPQEWEDGYTARLAGEYDLAQGRRVTLERLRLGGGYDWNPIPADTLSPIVPDSDRWLVSAGARLRVSEDVVADVAVMGVIFRDRPSELEELPVEYSNFAVLTGVTLRWLQ